MERLRPCFAAVDGAAAGHLAAAGCFGDARVDGQVRKLQTDHAVVGGQGEVPQLLHHPKRSPLVAAAAQGPIRAGGVGDALVAAAKDQDAQELVKDDPVGDAPTVAAKWVRIDPVRQQCGELVPEGFDDAGWQDGHAGSW
jgi:hypothetical protein